MKGIEVVERSLVNCCLVGTRMAPAFASLFMGEFERKALEGYVYKPFL